MAYVASRLAHGELLYRDVSIPLTPGCYYILAALFQVFGEYLIVGRMWVLLVGWITCGLVYRVGASVSHRNAGFCAALCYCFWATAHFVSPRPTYEANALTLLSLWWIGSYCQKGGKMRLAAGGVAAGLSFLAKQNIGLAAPVAVIVASLGLWAVRASRGRLREYLPPMPPEVFLVVWTIGYLFVLFRTYAVASAVAALWCLLLAYAHATSERRRELCGRVIGLRDVLLFVACSVGPFAAAIVIAWAAGLLPEMMWNVFGLSTRFVTVGPSRMWSIASFLGARLLNPLFAVAAVYGSVRCVHAWRRGQRVAGLCFGLIGLTTVAVQGFAIESELMSLASLWHFYAPEWLLSAAFLLSVLVAGMLVFHGARLARQPGGLISGVYLILIACLVLGSKWGGAEGKLAKAVAEMRYHNPWGILLLTYVCALSLAARDWLAGKSRPGAMPVLLGGLFATGATLVTSQTFDHLVLSSSPVFCAAAYLIGRARHRVWGPLAVSICAGLGLTAAIDNRAQSFAYGPAYTQNYRMRSRRARLIRAEKKIARPTEDVAEWLRSHTSPTDSVFVCDGNVMIYFLASRRFDSRHFQTNKFAIPEIRRDVEHDLRRCSVVVLATEAGEDEPPGLRRMIMDRFTPVATVGGYTILEPRPPQRGKRAVDRSGRDLDR